MRKFTLIMLCRSASMKLWVRLGPRTDSRFDGWARCASVAEISQLIRVGPMSELQQCDSFDVSAKTLIVLVEDDDVMLVLSFGAACLPLFRGFS